MQIFEGCILIKIIKVDGCDVLVDNDQYVALTKHKWKISFSKGIRYAYRRVVTGHKANWKTRVAMMHRDILVTTQDIDHIDGNGLNNQRSNLREVNQSQNAMNQRKTAMYMGRPTSSIYKGVCKTTKGMWMAQICKNKQLYYLGKFETPLEAAKAYDVKALELYGNFARTNKMMGLY